MVGEKGVMLPGEGPSKQSPLFFSLMPRFGDLMDSRPRATGAYPAALLRCMMPPGRNRPYLSEKGRSTTTAPPGAARSGHTTWHEQTGVWHGGAARTMEQSWFFCFILLFLPHSDTAAGTPGWEAGRGHEFTAVVEYVCGPSP